MPCLPAWRRGSGPSRAVWAPGPSGCGQEACGFGGPTSRESQSFCRALLLSPAAATALCPPPWENVAGRADSSACRLGGVGGHCPALGFLSHTPALVGQTASPHSSRGGGLWLPPPPGTLRPGRRSLLFAPAPRFPLGPLHAGRSCPGLGTEAPSRPAQPREAARAHASRPCRPPPHLEFWGSLLHSARCPTEAHPLATSRAEVRGSPCGPGSLVASERHRVLLRTSLPVRLSPWPHGDWGSVGRELWARGRRGSGACSARPARPGPSHLGVVEQWGRPQVPLLQDAHGARHLPLLHPAGQQHRGLRTPPGGPPAPTPSVARWGPHFRAVTSPSGDARDPRVPPH